MKTILVHCKRNGVRFKTYTLPYEEPHDRRTFHPTSRNQLEDQAKTYLTNDELASPPYTNISFDIDYPK
jgi:hypothetical protein